MSMKILFIIAYSADPDKMSHYAAFHLGLHCFPKYRFVCIQNEKSSTCNRIPIAVEHGKNVASHQVLHYLLKKEKHRDRNKLQFLKSNLLPVKI